MAAKQGPARSMRGVPVGKRSGPKPKEDDEEPQQIIGPVTKIPALPLWLTAHENQGCNEARERWNQICTSLIQRQCLGSEHLPAVEQLCFAYQKLKKIQGIIKVDGEVLRDKFGRVSKVHPLTKERSNLLILIRGYLHDFGLIPPKGSVASYNKPTGGPKGRDLKESPFDED